MKQFGENVTYEEVEEYMIKHFWHLLQLSSLVWNLKPKWIWISAVQYIAFLSLLVYSCYLTSMTTLILKDYEMSMMAQAAHITCGVVVTLVILIVVPFHRSSQLALLDLCQKNFYNYGASFDNNEVEIWNEKTRKFNKILIILFSVLYSLIGIHSLVLGPLMDKDKAPVQWNKDKYYICLDTPIPFYFPYTVDTPLKTFLSIMTQLCLTLFILMILCAATIEILYFMENLCTQLKILLLSIKKIEERSLNICKIKFEVFEVTNMHDLYNNKIFMKEYEFCIKQNIEHHYIIIRAFTLVNLTARWPLFGLVLVLSLAIALALLAVLKGDQRYSPIIFSFLLLALELAAFGLICFKSQKITDLSEEVFSAYYKTNWFYSSESAKKSMRIFQERAKKPLCLTIGGFHPVNWELFSSVMNTAYSYFNLMFAVKD